MVATNPHYIHTNLGTVPRSSGSSCPRCSVRCSVPLHPRFRAGCNPCGAPPYRAAIGAPCVAHPLGRLYPPTLAGLPPFLSPLRPTCGRCGCALASHYAPPSRAHTIPSRCRRPLPYDGSPSGVARLPLAGAAVPLASFAFALSLCRASRGA